MLEIIQNPQREGQEVKSLTDSLVSREEEERHQKMLGEIEQLKKQIEEMEERIRELNQKLQERGRQRVSGNNIGTSPVAFSAHRNQATSKVIVVDPLINQAPHEILMISSMANRLDTMTANIHSQDLVETSPSAADHCSDSGLAEESFVFPSNEMKSTLSEGQDYMGMNLVKT